MTPVTLYAAPPRASRAGASARLAAVGDWLRLHQKAVLRLQWGVVLVYAVLLIVPAVMPLPDNAAHIWNDVSLFARFVFWGIWWPGVLISMLLFGRLWCGIFCPEGALTALLILGGSTAATILIGFSTVAATGSGAAISAR